MKIIRISPERQAEIRRASAATSAVRKAVCNPEYTQCTPTDPVDGAGITYFEKHMKGYQLELCKWMTERAEPTDGYPAGGALLLEPGLGKTLTTLYFLFSTVLPSKPKDVGPVILVMARNCRAVWFSEIARIANWMNQKLVIGTVNGSAMDVHSCHFLVMTPNRLAKMAEEAKDPDFSPVPGKLDPRVFFSTLYSDVVVDEADMLRNGDDTTWWEGVAAIKRKRTWALTGTPVHKSETDFYNLLLLIGVPIAVSKTNFATVRSLMTRRLTLAEVSKADSSLSLPPCRVHEHYLDFATPEETEAYARMFSITCEVAVEEVRNRAPGGCRGRKGGTFTTHLTSLRRACVIPALSRPTIQSREEEESGASEERPAFVLTNASAKNLVRSLARGKRPRPDRDRMPSETRCEIPVGPLGDGSTKMCTVKDFVRTECEERPTLVFSQWLDPVFLLQRLLTEGGTAGVEVYHGMLNTQEQDGVIARVRAGGVKVLIATISSAKSSLNLTEFCTVVFMDPVLDPQDAVQAVHRVHRHGQKRPVNVHHFLMNSTVEVRVHAISQSHRALADGLVDGGLVPHGRVVVTSERFLSEFNQPTDATTTQWRSSAVRAAAVASGTPLCGGGGIPQALLDKMNSLRRPESVTARPTTAGSKDVWTVLATDMAKRKTITVQDLADKFKISDTAETGSGKSYLIFVQGKVAPSYLAPWRMGQTQIPVYSSMTEFKSAMVAGSSGSLHPFIPVRGIFERMGQQFDGCSAARAIFFEDESKLLMFKTVASSD